MQRSRSTSILLWNCRFLSLRAPQIAKYNTIVNAKEGDVEGSDFFLFFLMEALAGMVVAFLAGAAAADIFTKPLLRCVCRAEADELCRGRRSELDDSSRSSCPS